MKIFIRFICALAALTLALSMISCKTDPEQTQFRKDDSIALIMSEMSLSLEDAGDVLELLVECGLDAEIDYIYAETENKEEYFKIWFGLNLMKVYFIDGEIVKIYKNQMLVYPEDTQSLTDTGTEPAPSEILIETTEAPIETDFPTETDGKLDLKLISITDPITPGKKVTVKFLGFPNREYDISVIYTTGESQAAGLEPKLADPYGEIAWTWRVGASVKPGTYTINIRSGNLSYTMKFEVEESDSSAK